MDSEGVRTMTRNTLTFSLVSLLLCFPAFADDDAATGMPSGKRQHKPVSATQPQDEEQEEAQGTRVRKTMQDLKNSAQDPTPAMNKAELTESLAKPAAQAVDEKRVPETLRHRDRSADDKTRGKKRDARKAAQERAEEIAAGKKDDDAGKTDKSEQARAKKKP